MNRKKIILLWSSLETFLLALLLTLVFSHAIGMMAFLASVIFLSIVSTAVLVIILRKFPQ